MLAAADLTAATEQTAATYYNSVDADQFCAHVWGDEGIHIGLYEGDHECIAAASRRTVEALATLIGPLEPGGVVVDLGSGYGGAARYLPSTHQLRVEAVTMSSVEHDRYRTLHHRSGLQDLIGVHDASFEAIPLPNGCADLGSPERCRSWGASVGLVRQVWDEQTAMMVRY